MCSYKFIFYMQDMTEMWSWWICAAVMEFLAFFFLNCRGKKNPRQQHFTENSTNNYEHINERCEK